MRRRQAQTLVRLSTSRGKLSRDLLRDQSHEVDKCKQTPAEWSHSVFAMFASNKEGQTYGSEEILDEKTLARERAHVKQTEVDSGVIMFESGVEWTWLEPIWLHWLTCCGQQRPRTAPASTQLPKLRLWLSVLMSYSVQFVTFYGVPFSLTSCFRFR